jgi:hypothetical protein
LKAILLLLAATSLFFIGCGKPDDSDDETITPVIDTREYFVFKLTSDTFNNEFIVLDTGSSQNTSGNFLTAPVSLRIDVSRNGKTLVGFFNINARKEGLYAFDTITRGGIFLPGYKGNPNMFSQSGHITITHFPVKNMDYITGTFSGTFVDIHDSTHLFTITEGRYRIQRKD